MQLGINRRASARRQAAFTLVELLVVIGIMALLMGMLMPALSKARQQAVSLACQANLRTCGQMMILYAQDNKDALFPHKLGAAYPPAERWPTKVFAGAMSAGNPMPKVLLCPADVEIGQEDMDEATKWNCPVEYIKHSYLANMHIYYDGIRFSRTRRVSASDIILMGEKKSSHSDFRMNSSGPGGSQYNDLVENERHGKFRRSNLLFMDGHVDRMEPAPWIGPNGEKMDDPWDILPGGDYKE